MRKVIEKIDDFRVILNSTLPEVFTKVLDDEINGGEISIRVSVRRMGVDTGMDTLVNVGNSLQKAIDHTLGATRQS